MESFIFNKYYTYLPEWLFDELYLVVWPADLLLTVRRRLFSAAAATAATAAGGVVRLPLLQLAESLVDPTEAGGAHPLCTRRDFCTHKKNTT